MKDLPGMQPLILYVDDEAQACKYFEKAFNDEFEIRTVLSADDAIKILDSRPNRIGVLVTDYRMPGCDGGQLLRQVGKIHPYIVCILVTAYADRNTLLTTINSAELFRILEKPIDLAKTRLALREALRLARDRIMRGHSLIAINDTLAFLAHELNTPLAAIVNFSRGIERRLVNDNVTIQTLNDIRRAGTAILDNARFSLEVLSIFVESARDADKEHVVQKDYTAGELVHSLLETYPMTHAQRSAIHLNVTKDFRIPALPSCVSLVFSSLLHNALRAMQEVGQPTLTINVLNEEKPQIIFIDNGEGISEEILGKLAIDPVTTHANSGGSGRGMMFCDRIMRAFGGSLEIQSKVGSGTTVILYFPSETIKYRKNEQ